MKTIKLTRGLYALVDDDQYEFLNQWDWYAEVCKSGYYATRGLRDSEKQITLRMHRVVKKAKTGQMVDHVDGSGLNNQDSNLRFCQYFQNSGNQRIGHRNTSGFKGVSWDKYRLKWDARVKGNGEVRRLGRFSTAILAAKAYDAAALEIFGEFALTNKMLGLL